MITNPIVFTAEEVELIVATISAEDFGSNSWSNDALEDLRSRIKRYYIGEQAYECCYCKQRLYADHGRLWDIEHVIARALKCGFMFEPRNLAIACVECNGAKGTTPVSNPARVSFPDRSQLYKIVHPYFDEWDQHLELEGETTYRALSEKGKFTIYNCDLFRFWEREAKIRQPIRDKRFERDVGELRFAKSETEARPIIASILERIRIEEEMRIKGREATDDDATE
jgi:5-methylcytosine-specific restriction endonuclease McrA